MNFEFEYAPTFRATKADAFQWLPKLSRATEAIPEIWLPPNFSIAWRWLWWIGYFGI